MFLKLLFSTVSLASERLRNFFALFFAFDLLETNSILIGRRIQANIIDLYMFLVEATLTQKAIACFVLN